MSCDMPSERLWVWVHGEEDDATAERDIASHVATCDRCQARADEMRGLLAGIRLAAGAVGQAGRAAALPKSIGSYRIIRRIGQGGMGVVYEAEQQTPQRSVALKVIRGFADADEYRLRLFRREAQTLARLSHPSIAAIYEAGSADGQQYFAMELVQGVSLGDYAAGRRSSGAGAAPSSLMERVRLFVQICEAINYAHQRGVIHRDLKPGNILVSDDGRPKVLDFGLARISDSDVAAVTVATETGRLLGTLPYMSPEQARGQVEAIDVRTDVYALGVILYELVTGELPVRVAQTALHEAVQRICEQPPRNPRSLNGAVPRDVSVIAMKAVEKEAGRRYQTVAGLQDDLVRFLNGYPITARPASAAYRLAKFIRRHRAGTLLLTALFAVLVGALVVTQDLLSRARSEATKFRWISDVLQSVLVAPDPARQGDRSVTVYDALRAADRRIVMELDDQPLESAAVRNTLGNTFLSFSDYDAAERHLRFALQTRRERLGEDHVDVAQSLNDLGELLLLRRSGYDEAEAALKQALAIRRRRLPGSEELAATLNNLGLLHKQLARTGEASAEYREALSIRTRIFDAALHGAGVSRSEKARAANALAQTRNNLAGLLRAEAARLGPVDGAAAARLTTEAEHEYEAVLALRTAWLDANHPDVAKALNNYALVLADAGKASEAERCFRRALEILRQAYGPDHEFVARGQRNLADLLRTQRRFNEAAELLTEALAIIEKRLGTQSAEATRTRALMDRVGKQDDAAGSQNQEGKK
ncbi:Serine/threonine-protein kinase PrkC [Phycisphaerae bacterium RAS1]|nr:Serine/threonine-protein kinase PrkC [Phycisphaerae bacterium RAS1]